MSRQALNAFGHAVLLFSLLLTACQPVNASDSSCEILIVSDARRDTGSAIKYWGDVDISFCQAEIAALSAAVEFNPDRTVKRVLVRGQPARYVERCAGGDIHGSAKSIVYIVSSGEVVLSENAVVRQGDAINSGRRVRHHIHSCRLPPMLFGSTDSRHKAELRRSHEAKGFAR